MVEIPQDIIDNIIETLAVDDYDDGRFLKRCAVVSSSFLLPCRKHLFSKLSLRFDETCQSLHQFLVENPGVLSFVRSIAIKPTYPRQWNRTWFIAILRLPFRCLESFYIDNKHYQLNWNKDFSSELKDALLSIIHSSTLKNFYLENIFRVPTMMFLGINLTTLGLTNLLRNNFDDVQSRVVTSEEVATTVVDHCVWIHHVSICSRPVHRTIIHTSIYFSLIWDIESPSEPIFLPFLCRPRLLEFGLLSSTIDDLNILSFVVRSLRVSLTPPATLEHLKLNIEFQDYNLND